MRTSMKAGPHGSAFLLLSLPQRPPDELGANLAEVFSFSVDALSLVISLVWRQAKALGSEPEPTFT